MPLLVYRRDDAPLDPEADGAVMLQIAQLQAGQVVDARWAVKDVVTVEVLPGTSQ